MAQLYRDECGRLTNVFGSWDTPIKILCKICSDKPKHELRSAIYLRINGHRRISDD